MDKSLKWRLGVVALALIAALFFALPTFTNNLPSWWAQKKISLGLDLKGGIHLVMGVDLDVVLQNSVGRLADEYRRSLAEESILATKVAPGSEPLTIVAEFPEAESLTKAEELLVAQYASLVVSGRDNLILTLTLSPEAISETKEMTLRQALETIRNRVDMFGVAEPDIRPQGEDRIVIQLPGIKDPQRAVALIGKTAQLEFKLVDDSRSAQWALANGIPAGREILYGREIDPTTGQEIRTPYLLRKIPLMTGENLTNARVTMTGQFGEPQVSITFDSRGARQFERVTGEYVHQRMAIVLDNTVYSAPTINERIGGGRAVISGSFTADEARDLAVALRAGALPAPVVILEERTVGPTLGADSIRQGLEAGLLGLGAVLVFMAIYYRRAGFIAGAALLFNFPIVLAVLASFGATLTLPGIFGLILTLGMAVDANVLIFERIREEIRAGKTPKAAVAAGFGRAFWTIFDSNLTTLITAMVLYQFGSGPIRGFAVTLSVGILSSMFTAIFFSRVIFDLSLSGRKVERISI